MGYVVNYSNERPPRFPMTRWLLTSLFFVSFLAFTIRFCPEGREVIMRFLLPENSSAIEVFVEEFAKEPTILDLFVSFVSHLF